MECTIQSASFTQHSVKEVHPCCGFIVISFLVISSRIPLHGTAEFVTHSPVQVHLGSLQCLAIVSEAILDLRGQSSFVDLRYGIAWLYG